MGLDFDGRGFVTLDEFVFLEDNYLNRKLMEKSPEALCATRTPQNWSIHGTRGILAWRNALCPEVRTHL